MTDISPLSGLRVLDLSRVLAGPLCTMMLGDMGADVIKAERVGTGDETRGWGPPFDQRGESAYYLSVNRNKKSLAVDLDRSDDQELLRRLAAEADVVVENFLPGALRRRGLGADSLRDRHPRLVWCTITGFGAESARPGYDVVVQAERGWMAITGETDGPPMRAGVAIADVMAGKDACVAILAALLRRERLGQGARIVISLADSAAAALINVAQSSLVTGSEAKRWGNAHPNLVPYQLFDAADRPMVVAVGSDAQWSRCALALDLPELAADPGLVANAGRVRHRSRVVTAVASRLAERAAAAWVALLSDAGVPCGVVKGVLETLSEVECSPLTGIAPSVPGSVRLPPPLLDEHGDEIRRLGWTTFGPAREDRPLAP